MALRSRLTLRAILDADAVLGRRRRSRPVDLDAQHHAGRLAPELHVEDFQPVAGRHAAGHRPDLLDDRRFASHGTGFTACKQKKWAHAHSVLHPGSRTRNYSTANPESAAPCKVVVAWRADDLDLDEIAGAEARRVAVGQVDRGVDVGRLGRQPAPSAPARGRTTGRRRARGRARRCGRAGASATRCFCSPITRARRAVLVRAGTSSSSS